MSKVMKAILAVFLLAFAHDLYGQYMASKEVKVIPVTTVTDTVIQEVIDTDGGKKDSGYNYPPKITDSAKEIAEKVEEARKGDVQPTVFLPLGVSQSVIQDKVNGLGGDYALSERTEQGTYIYSITNRKTKHAWGLYMGLESDDGTAVEYGLHHRNGRLVIQAGRDTRSDFDVRVAYELIQW